MVSTALPSPASLFPWRRAGRKNTRGGFRVPQHLWGGPSSVCVAQRGCRPRHDPTAGGLPGGDESWAAARAGCAPAEIPVIWGFLAFWAPARFCVFPSGSGSPSSGAGGTPWEGPFFFFPFLGVDARSEQQNAAETEADERASPATPLPAFGGHQLGMAAPELPGERGQEVLAPTLGTGWRRTEKQHQRGAAPTGNEHHPPPSIAAPGSNHPWRILRGRPSPRTPTRPTPRPDAVPRDKPRPPAAL